MMKLWSPKLWTPDRKVRTPSPKCTDCGGIIQQHYSANRHRMGFMYHRACCCKKKICGTTTFNIEISGVNAGICGCVHGGSSSYDFTDLDVDGTHQVTKSLDTDSSFTIYPNDVGVIGALTYRYHDSESDCTGDYEEYTTDVYLYIQGNCTATGNVTINNIDLRLAAWEPPTYAGHVFYWSGSDESLPYEADNENECVFFAFTPFGSSNGGTVEVSIV